MNGEVVRVMGYGFMHIITAWIFGRTYEIIAKKKLTQQVWFFLLLGGILPDIDHLIDWGFGVHIHRTFTHSLLFVLVMMILFAGVLMLLSLVRTLSKKEITELVLALGFGIAIHLFLDMITFGVGVPLLWPSLWYVSLWNGVQYIPALPNVFNNLELLQFDAKIMILDMGLGAAWVFYLVLRKKIKF